jgi:CRISPR associated protein Cas1.
VRKEDEVFEVSVNKVDSILITTAAYISTDAIKFAVDNNIDLVFLIRMGILMDGCGIPSWEARH